MTSILLVEDNDDHAMLACAALSASELTFHIDRAVSADQCLTMLGNKSYDAIILDYSLPKRSGLDALREIEKGVYDVPVVMITSHGDEEVAVEAMKRGAYDYVVKSSDYLNKLPLVVQKTIVSHELAREKAELQAEIAESENRLRNIFENVNVGVIEVQKDHSISYINSTAERYLSTADNSEDMDICHLFSKVREDKKLYSGCIIDNCLESGESATCEIELTGRQFSATITPIKENHDGVKQLIIVLIDVTDRLRLQQQLLQSERIRVLGRMASGVAHDFNNILAVILGQTEFMLMDPADTEKVESGLRVIQETALHGADVVKRMQEFTRVARQKEFTRFDINIVVRDAVKITEPRWKDEPQRDGVKIDIKMELNSRNIISGNASDLREVLTNIIFNATDAMPEGGELCIKTYDRSDHVFISISDTGTGIAPDAINSIFEPFFTTKGVGYTGLGLSVAYGIITRHEGTIDVDSSQGKGTTFTIKLIACVESIKSEKGAIDLEPGKANVLVIDDEETIRRLLTDILTRFKHNVVAASDGISGIEAFKNGKFDVVFTDLGMPELSGWEVAEEIKAIDPSAKIVLITGWGAELDKDELQKSKVDSIISKPFHINQVLEMVSKVLEAKE